MMDLSCGGGGGGDDGDDDVYDVVQVQVPVMMVVMVRIHVVDGYFLLVVDLGLDGLLQESKMRLVIRVQT